MSERDTRERSPEPVEWKGGLILDTTHMSPEMQSVCVEALFGPADPRPVEDDPFPDLLREAAQALVDRLAFVTASDEYIGVFQMAEIHGAPYTGPSYEAELAALKAALRTSDKRSSNAPATPESP